ncbi:sarcalumenin isoform X1 [Cydia fagiglandana]|uniref:sarcalumenin isoform X1 n=1 Tax=Cydia fagiglandana TaxID=1458189 RepID=UPI002FEE4925
MWTKRQLWRYMLCILFAVSALAAAARADDVPSESQCRPYIEKALKELESDTDTDSSEKHDSSEVSIGIETKEADSAEDSEDSKEDGPSVEVADEPYVAHASIEVEGGANDNESKEEEATVEDAESAEGDAEDSKEGDSKEDGEASAEDKTAESESGEDKDETQTDESQDSQEDGGEDDDADSKETQESEKDSEDASEEKASDDDDDDNKSDEAADASEEQVEESDDSKASEDGDGSQEKAESEEDTAEDKDASKEDTTAEDKDESAEQGDTKEEDASQEDDKSGENQDDSAEEQDDEPQADKLSKDDDDDKSGEETAEVDEKSGEDGESAEGEEDSTEEEAAEEELLNVPDIPKNLRSRDHIAQILRLDEEASEAELTIERSAEIVLRDIKRLYENSIKPLETLYKYRDLSNRHFGDPEIFSKPLVLFMGPWSGGKSSILNYLTGLEFTEWALRTGAEPSPAYFNILMHGKDPEVLDGTQLAADWTFSGLQKFGQGLEERLRGLRHPSKILEKVNIVEIPGILEVRKQVSRVFPFNDACQWFIDRADIIFLVYDPSKLDVGPETEAILDQLKGRESQTRIVLNKADTVKPEELMRVQSALIWNISPLMSSAQPPVMYTASLWSMPFEAGAPVRLLQAQERELLRDLRQAIDKRVENKISSARRFAVRVRNHAKMVDCYLTTYYNHKTIFGNKKLIADAIIENPQNYHIYEGLSTLTNISRYDLPDPETYRDFFRLNPLYEFQQLSATCTYFRGCPINKLDVAIAYDLPEIVGKYKKMVETSTPQGMPKS